MPTGAGLRPGAKATEHPPDPTGGAPVLDPTGERGGGNVPTGLGLRPGAKAPDEPPTPYRLRASPRLYTSKGIYSDLDLTGNEAL